MPPRRRTRRRNTNGPTVVPIPSSFRKHHSHLSPFARSHLPMRTPMLGSVAKLQALAEAQLDELCEDVVVLLSLWGTGLPPQTLAAGQPPTTTTTNGSSGSSTPTSPASTTATGTLNPFATTTQATPIHLLPPSPPGSGTNTPAPSHAIQVATHTLPGVPPPSHHPSQGAPPPPGTGNPNHPDMRPPTEADAIALAPNLPIWLPGAPRKRNESRVKLARSFMAGFEGMKALVWDVTLELERRWPLREQEEEEEEDADGRWW